jgi:protein SCO1/2
MAVKGARIGAALAVLILIGIGALLWAQARTDNELPVISGIGGAFALVDRPGNAVTDRDYVGAPTLIFFGFAHCPDVCPTTLFELTNRLKELGPDADRLNVLFITVDPDRDTPEQMALYLSSFDPHITGLSKATENIAAVIMPIAFMRGRFR